MPPPRSSLLDRAPIVGKLNTRLQGAWDSGWLKPIELEPDWLWQKAAKGFGEEDERGGRSDEDVADFRDRLSVLCQSINAEARLNPIGQSFAYGQLVRAIRQRLELGRLWRAAPAIPDTALAKPIIIIGQMRSGTTRMHRLLAADPAHTATRFCDSWHPVPTKPDLRPVWSGMALFWARRLNPWIDTIHPFGASQYDEELGWLASALDHSAYEAQWRIPAYTAFSETRSAAPVYREFARILRTDANHHGNADQPRVMKVPQFAEDLEELLARFPGARLIICRRNDDDVLRSSVSMVANQMAMQSDNVDADWIEREWQRKLALREARLSKALAKHDGAVAEASFDALGADWLGEIRRIYSALQIELTDAASAAMDRQMRRSESSPHLGHRQQLDKMNAG